jgi:hypothetical protein
MMEDDGRHPFPVEQPQPKPCVFIHGLFGWGEQTPLWGAAPLYFPLDEIRKARPHGVTVAVAVGVNSSNHDRACEAFAQLYGLQTDYGEQHSIQCGHAQYGTDYTESGLLDCEWDEDHPVHIIGHSFGGNTALALVSLLAQDYWGIGTSAAWVASVSTICSPLRGCTLPFAWGLEGVEAKLPAVAGSVAGAKGAHGSGQAAGGLAADGRERPCWCRGGQVPRLFSVTHGLCLLCTPLIKAQFTWPWLKGLYDLRLSQWGDPYAWQAASMRHPLWINGDNMLAEATPAAAAQTLRRVRPHLRSAYLVSVTCDQTAPMPTPSARQIRAAKIASACACAALALAVHRFRRQIRAGLRNAMRDARRYLLALLALAALLRHRTTRRLRSPKLAALVAVGTIGVLGATAGAAAAAATVLRIPLRPSAWTDGTLQQLQPLRPLVERLRPALHAYLLPWLVRPALRLNSAAIHRTAKLLQGDLRVSFASTFATDDNDGVVDLPSHVGVDSVERVAAASHAHCAGRAASSLRAVASADCMDAGDRSSPRAQARWPRANGSAAAREGGRDADAAASPTKHRSPPPSRPSHGATPPRNFSQRDVATWRRGALLPVEGYEPGAAVPPPSPPSSPEVPAKLSSVVGGRARGAGRHDSAVTRLDRGQWHIMRVPGADHSLGTWASDKSDEMYKQLLALLDAQP